MLDLYISEQCPYCLKVMEYFNNNGIKYNKLVVTIPENHANLLKLGGKEQVPFLHDVHNNKTIYESDDIINYARNL